MHTKALALLSGGLDSTLAIRVVQEQNIKVEALNFRSIFCTCTPKTRTCSASKTAADQLGVDLAVQEITEEFIDVVKHPPHGYGRNMNPCIDCRILKFRKAAEYMRKTGASFLITGEVLGQRPMSQRMDAMKLIDREAGVEGLVLRPLCAGRMPVTIPEREGLVDRSKLLSIQGRSRKPQIALAEEYDIRDYPCPAGGCRLTDPGFAKRMKDLIEHNPDLSIRDIQLLTLGRHFRISDKAKLVVGRNEDENNKLSAMKGDRDVFFYPCNVMGPVGIGTGNWDSETVIQGIRIVAGYCRIDQKAEIEISVEEKGKTEIMTVKADPALKETLDRSRI